MNLCQSVKRRIGYEDQVIFSLDEFDELDFDDREQVHADVLFHEHGDSTGTPKSHDFRFSERQPEGDGCPTYLRYRIEAVGQIDALP